MRPVYLCLFVFSFSVLSCVSTSKFKAAQQEAQKYDTLYTWSQRTLTTCQENNNDLTKQKASMQNHMNDLDLQITATKENNTLLRKQLRDLSALSSAQAESIKKSMDNMGSRDTYFRDLQSAISHRDSANLVVLMELKATIGGFGEQDVNIKVNKGVIYVDLSDRLLFNSDSTGSSYTLSDKSKTVLGRLARVLNDQPDVEFMVEGHTDSIAYPQDSLQTTLLDNWDLSVKRATSLVRNLQKEYNISPLRMTASGRSEYITVDNNDTPEGRAANRRTRIIILPQLDPLLKVLDHRQGQPQEPTPPPPPPPAVSES